MAPQERPATMLGAEFSALEKVPPDARVFGFWAQAVLWFGAASLPAAWYYGALMAGWKGLPGAFLLIFLVSTVTFLPWALLGRIAARTGACSMAMVRPTFGLRGSVLQGAFAIAGHRWIRWMEWLPPPPPAARPGRRARLGVRALAGRGPLAPCPP